LRSGYRPGETRLKPPSRIFASWRRGYVAFRLDAKKTPVETAAEMRSFHALRLKLIGR
jgi:hypothetical protein